MRYLKLFEDSDPMYYDRITQAEYNISRAKSIDFLEPDFLKIRGLFGKRVYRRRDTADREYISDGNITIYSLEDEYFTVAAGYEIIYKCDQIEGLLRCLRSEFKYE